MQKIILTLLIVLNSFFSFAQTTINGKVVDAKNKPVAGVSITLQGTYDGATTNATGEYKFKTTNLGTYNLVASTIGYSKGVQSIIVDGKPLEINFVIKEKINEMKAVRITAGSFEASDEKKGTILKPLDIVTTAGSNGDNYSALKTLPGTQQALDRDGLFVRGGTGAETQTFIDGTLVRNAFLTGIPDLGSRGRFSPFLFKGTVFSTGGYSALYGQALSAAVILETEDIPEKSQGFASLSSVGIGAGILEVNKKRTQSFSVGYNLTYLGVYFALMKQNIDYNKMPTYHQIDATFRKKIGKTGLVKIYSYINTGSLAIARNDINSYQFASNNFLYKNAFSLTNHNAYINASFKDYLNKNWKVNIGACYSTNTDKINIESENQNGTPTTDTLYTKYNANINSNNQIATAKVVFTKNLNNLNNLRLGAEHIYFLDFNNYNAYPTAKISDQYSAAFAEGDIYVTNNIAGKIGVRAEHSTLLDKWNIAPRLSLAYKLSSKAQLSAAYGIFYQKPETKYLFYNTSLTYSRADHYIVNYLYQTKGRLLRLEAYYKQYSNLIKTPYTINTFAPTVANNSGTGYAQGFEVFYKDTKTIKNFDYWISYSYTDTKRNFLNYMQSVQPDFVATHNASLVMKRFFVKRSWGINGTYTFASGRPYINYNQTNPFASTIDSSLFMKDRTKAYHNVSVSFNYLKPIGKTFNVFVVGINNLLMTPQVYGYNYSLTAKNADGSLYRQAITPAAKMFVFVGWFMSWGVDKSDDAINNNL